MRCQEHASNLAESAYDHQWYRHFCCYLFVFIAPMTPATHSPDLSQLANHRHQFPALGNKTYFNYGGQGPLPTAALRAIQQAYEQIQTQGPFSGQALTWVFGQVAQARGKVAAELGVAPETLSFTESVSVGCNIALWGVDWQPGDRLVISDCEHPGIIAAVQQLQRRFGVDVAEVKLQHTLNGGDPAALVAAAIAHPRTKLLVISHICWNTGQVLPLAEIVACCHQNSTGRVAVLVDAAQSVGVLPLDLGSLGADFYAFTGHKWWCGPEGVGGLYIDPAAFALLQPMFIGWRGIISDPTGLPIDWKPDGRKFEVATAAFPLCMGLAAAVEVHQAWGTAQARYQRICELSAYLWQQLSDLSGLHCLHQQTPAAGLVSFQLENGQHAALVNYLEAKGIMVRLIPDPNCVRAGVHYFSLESECDKLVEAISEFRP
jgi:L-cysteine/cystine lyase